MRRFSALVGPLWVRSSQEPARNPSVAGRCRDRPADCKQGGQSVGAFCRPLPPERRVTGTGTGGKDAPSFEAATATRPACVTDCANSFARSAATHHGSCGLINMRHLLFKANLLAVWPEQARSTRATCYNWESKSRARGWGWHGSAAENQILTREPPRRAALAQFAPCALAF